MKVFARLQTGEDQEEMVNGMLCKDVSRCTTRALNTDTLHHTDEQALRKHISDLQEYRQAGLTTFAEVDKYEKEKGQRVGYA